MGDLRVKGKNIFLFGKQIHLVFNLNVMDKISDSYLTVEEMAKAVGTAKGQKTILTALINDAVETHNENETDARLKTITENWVGQQVGAAQMSTVSALIVDAFALSVPKSEIEMEDDLGNRKAE